MAEERSPNKPLTDLGFQGTGWNVNGAVVTEKREMKTKDGSKTWGYQVHVLGMGFNDNVMVTESQFRILEENKTYVRIEGYFEQANGRTAFKMLRALV